MFYVQLTVIVYNNVFRNCIKHEQWLLLLHTHTHTAYWKFDMHAFDRPN